MKQTRLFRLSQRYHRTRTIEVLEKMLKDRNLLCLFHAYRIIAMFRIQVQQVMNMKQLLTLFLLITGI